MERDEWRGMKGKGERRGVRDEGRSMRGGG